MLYSFATLILSTSMYKQETMLGMLFLVEYSAFIRCRPNQCGNPKIFPAQLQADHTIYQGSYALSESYHIIFLGPQCC